jgi:chemotaxis protein MotA
MQILGLILLGFVIWYGFGERDSSVISAFDIHAFVMVLGGSFAAVMVSSTALTTFRTFGALRQILPGLGTLQRETDQLEAERLQLAELWTEGKRAQAVELAEGSRHPAMQRMLELVMNRAPEDATRSAFLDLKHAELARWQPAIGNWELLSKLAPSFGMIGTITGIIQMFRMMGESDMNLGPSLSLALVSTLYGVAFGAGVAGPIGLYLRNLLDERIGVLDRCEQSVGALVSVTSRRAG